MSLDLALGAMRMMTVMSVQAVVFDLGGILEITPDLGVAGAWEARLGLAPGELNERMGDAWLGGSIGTISEADVHRAAAERLGLDQRQLAEFMSDLWREYLGTANTELDDYEPCVEGARRAGIHAVLYRDNDLAIRDIGELLAR